MSRLTSTQLTATSGRRAPTAVAPRRGCGAPRPEVGRPAAEARRARRWGGRVRRDRPRRTRTRALRTPAPTTRRTRGLRRPPGPVRPWCRRARRTARRRGRRSAGARRRGRRSSTARRPRPRATGRRRPRRAVPGPASVNTDRWWSASACTSTSDGPHAARDRRRSRSMSRPSDTLTTHSSTAASVGVRPLDLAESDLSSLARMRIGLALPQYDYSVAGERPAAVRDDRRVRAARRARRRRIGLALRPPVPRPREVRRVARHARVLRPDRHARRARPCRAPRAARHARAARGVAARGGAREGAGDARLRERRPPRRRPGRGLVRTRVRGARHGDAPSRACGSTASSTRSRS